MPKLLCSHHVAIICSDYGLSKSFYVDLLGCTVIAEHYRSDRRSWKLDLGVNGRYALELFSFPDPPPRVSQPEAAGLRHIAFEVADLDASVAELAANGVPAEPVRTDEFTGKRFSFISDPDALPIEIYEHPPIS